MLRIEKICGYMPMWTVCVILWLLPVYEIIEYLTAQKFASVHKVKSE